MQYLFFSSKPKFISVVLIVANLDQQKFPCRDDLNTGQYGLKALGWLSLSKLCTTAKIWNGWSQATLPWVHNLSVWLLLASIPSWKFSETFNDVLQWMLTHFFQWRKLGNIWAALAEIQSKVCFIDNVVTNNKWYKKWKEEGMFTNRLVKNSICSWKQHDWNTAT